jgi:hypothetical protein
VTVTTVVFDAVRSKNGPEADELLSYQAAQWAAFAFGILGTWLMRNLRIRDRDAHAMSLVQLLSLPLLPSEVLA